MIDGGLSPEEDRQVMLRVMQGDVRAFEHLYKEYFSRVRAFLARGDGVHAEDLTQEVFIRAWQYRRRFRGESSAKTYLMGIAQNVLREQLRSGRKWVGGMGEVAEEAVAPAAEEAMADATVLETLEHAKRALPANQLQAIELVYYLQIKPAEAAMMVGCSYKAMRRRLEQARAHLRRILGHLLKA